MLHHSIIRLKQIFRSPMKEPLANLPRYHSKELVQTRSSGRTWRIVHKNEEKAKINSDKLNYKTHNNGKIVSSLCALSLIFLAVKNVPFSLLPDKIYSHQMPAATEL